MDFSHIHEKSLYVTKITKTHKIEPKNKTRTERKMRKTNPFIHCRCCLLVTSTELMIQPGLRQWKFIIGSAKNGSFHLRLRLLKAIWLKLMNTFFNRQTAF